MSVQKTDEATIVASFGSVPVGMRFVHKTSQQHYTKVSEITAKVIRTGIGRRAIKVLPVTDRVIINIPVERNGIDE